MFLKVDLSVSTGAERILPLVEPAEPVLAVFDVVLSP